MKKTARISLLLAVILMLFSGCNSIRNKTSAENIESMLNFEPVGEYHFEGFGEIYDQYTFDAPNDKWVVWAIGRSECQAYMVGCPETGRSYADVIVSGESRLIALSSQYFLFDTEKGKIAIDVSDMLNKVPAEDLTEEEMNSFVYPINYERILNIHNSSVKESLKTI